MAIECDHPRPPLDLPGYTPPRLAWQVPSYIPDLPPNAARVVREALQGVYQELTKLGQTRNVIPLYEDIFARPGAVIQGVGNGQTITLAQPGAQGYLDPVSLLLTDVTTPVNVVHPDGTVTTIGTAGAYTFEPAGEDAYATDTAAAILAGAVPTDTLLGRDTAGTGAVEFITLTAPLEFDGAGSVRLTPMAADTFLGRLAGTGAPATQALADIDSTSLVYDAATHTFQRAALTGDITAAQNVNATAFRSFSALSVLARAVNSAGVPTELTAGTNDRVLARSADTLAFQQVSTGMIADDAVTNAKLANMAEGLVKGRALGAGTGDPTDLTGAELAALIRMSTTHTASGAADLTDYVPAGVDINTISTILIDPAIDLLFNSLTPGAVGKQIRIVKLANSNQVTIVDEAAVGTAAMKFTCIGNTTTPNIVLRHDRSNVLIEYTASSRWEVVEWSPGIATTSNAGLVTPSTSLVMNASAIERAALTGDITSAQNSNATAFRSFTALSVLGRAANSLGAPADIAAVAASDAVLRESGSTIGWGTIATGGIADNAITNAKIRDSGALSVIGRSANSAGDPADISAVAASGAVLRESGGVLGFGTIATAGLADDSVTAAKLANMAQSTIRGRAEGAGTGDPQDLTPTEVIAIVDGESPTWTGSHTFNGTNFAVNAGADALIGATSGIGLFAAHTPAAVDTGDVAINATSGIAIVSDPTTPVVAAVQGIRLQSATDVRVFATSGVGLFAGLADADVSTGDAVVNASSGIALNVHSATPVTAVAGIALTTETNNITLSAGVATVLNTAGVQRLTIESDGSWNIGGSNGTIGHAIVSAGGSAPPAWGQVPTAGIADASVTLAKQANLAQSTIIGRAEGAGTGVPQALTPAQVVSIIDGESPTWTASHRFDSFIQFGTSTSLPATGDIRKTSTLVLTSSDDINLVATDDVLLDANDLITLDATQIDLTAANKISVNSGNGIQIGSTTGMPGTGDIRKGSGAALVINSGLDLTLNASDDIILAATDDVSVGGADISIAASATAAVSGGTSLDLSSAGAVDVDSGATLTLSGTTAVTMTAGGNVNIAPTQQIVLTPGSNQFLRIAGGVRRTEILANATNGQINDLAIGTVNTVRFTAADILTGMVPSGDWQEVYLMNANTGDDLLVTFESIDSTAANRFAGFGTSRFIRARDIALAVYDGTSSRWRLLVYPA